MHKEKIKVVYLQQTKINIAKIGLWIEQQGYPDTAVKFIEKLFEFGDSIGLMPEKYPLCHIPRLAKAGMHCVEFNGWVFIYKPFKNLVVVYNIVHSKTLFLICWRQSHVSRKAVQSLKSVARYSLLIAGTYFLFSLFNLLSSIK